MRRGRGRRTRTPTGDCTHPVEWPAAAAAAARACDLGGGSWEPPLLPPLLPPPPPPLPCDLRTGSPILPGHSLLRASPAHSAPLPPPSLLPPAPRDRAEERRKGLSADHAGVPADLVGLLDGTVSSQPPGGVLNPLRGWWGWGAVSYTCSAAVLLLLEALSRRLPNSCASPPLPPARRRARATWPTSGTRRASTWGETFPTPTSSRASTTRCCKRWGGAPAAGVAPLPVGAACRPAAFGRRGATAGGSAQCSGARHNQ